MCTSLNFPESWFPPNFLLASSKGSVTCNIPGKKNPKNKKTKNHPARGTQQGFAEQIQFSVCEPYGQFKIHEHNPWKKGRPWMSFGEQRTRALQSNSKLRVDWKRCHWAGKHKGAAGFHLCNAHGFSSWNFFVPPLWLQIAECAKHIVINDCIFHKTSLCHHHWGEHKKLCVLFPKIIMSIQPAFDNPVQERV